jgi:3-oxoacyl-[acyl-carrier protein] reductase
MTSDRRFSGKHVLVTGGTSGIGHAIALAFAEQGACVAIAGTNEERAKIVIHEMGILRADSAQKFTYLLVDVSISKEVERCLQHLLVDWGHIDILVNSAGVTRDGLLIKMSEEEWDLVVDINLKSLYNICRVLVRPMIKKRSGKIINISSVVGLKGNAGQVNYAASKAGIIGFTRYVCELCSAGFHSNTNDPVSF